MLQGMWGKGNPHSLLVGFQTRVATMKISVGNLHELNINLASKPVVALLGICLKDLASYSADTCSAMFTIVRQRKQSKCPPTDWVDNENVVDMYYKRQFRWKEKWSHEIYKVNGPNKRIIYWVRYQDPEKQMLHILSPLWFLAPNHQMLSIYLGISTGDQIGKKEGEWANLIREMEGNQC